MRPNCVHLYYLLYRLQPAQVTVLAYCPAASQLPSGRFVGTPNDKNENIVQVSLTFNCISASGALGKRNRWRGWQILFSQILLFLEINRNTFRNSILLAAQCSPLVWVAKVFGASRGCSCTQEMPQAMAQSGQGTLGARTASAVLNIYIFLNNFCGCF